jgi:hypothetical protein
MKTFPIYILDDQTVIHTKRDLDHADWWHKTVSKIVAEKHGITRRKLLNLPYCQRRARVVGRKLYCGEKISKKLHSQIEKAVGMRLKPVHDEHETRCPINLAEFRALKNPCPQ